MTQSAKHRVRHQVDCGASVDQHPVYRLAIDEALEIQSLQVLVAFLLGLLEDDWPRAEIQLRDSQFFRLGCPKLRWEHEHHIHISRWPLVGFCLLGAPLLPWGGLSSLRGRLICSARSGRAFLSTSRYLASASSRLRKRCTLRFCK